MNTKKEKKIPKCGTTKAEVPVSFDGNETMRTSGEHHPKSSTKT